MRRSTHDGGVLSSPELEQCGIWTLPSERSACKLNMSPTKTVLAAPIDSIGDTGSDDTRSISQDSR